VLDWITFTPEQVELYSKSFKVTPINYFLSSSAILSIKNHWQALPITESTSTRKSFWNIHATRYPVKETLGVRAYQSRSNPHHHRFVPSRDTYDQKRCPMEGMDINGPHDQGKTL